MYYNYNDLMVRHFGDKSSTTLCIVDMQPKFPAAKNVSTVRGVVDLIHNSKQQQAPIVVLEYSGFGKTHYDIRQALDYYHNATYLIKDEDDGTNTISGHFGCLPSQMILCGVNLDACVLRTAQGLLKRGVRVTVKVNACNTDTVQSRNRTLAEIIDLFFKQKQLVVDWEQ